MSIYTEDAKIASYVYEAYQDKIFSLNEHRLFREKEWRTKDGRSIKIKHLSDEHLFNAYRLSGNNSLFKEMVMRLFEDRLAIAMERQSCLNK